MGRGEACEVLGPDGVVYRRGRRRREERTFEQERAASALERLSAPLIDAEEYGADLKHFIAARFPRTIVVTETESADGDSYHEFAWEGEAYQFDGVREAIAEAERLLSQSLYGGIIRCYRSNGSVSISTTCGGVAQWQSPLPVELEEMPSGTVAVLLANVLVGYLDEATSAKLRTGALAGLRYKAVARNDLGKQVWIEISGERR